ncbi:DSBA-like thioredoxin domain-containing protein [Trichoderma pleuroticola]
MANYDIKIISDTVCPFCYLARARIDRAITLFKKTVPNASSATFAIRWHAFQLDKSIPHGQSTSVQDMAVQRFGADRLAAKRARMAQLGDQEGFGFTFAGRIGNTRDSHRLAHLGRALGGWELEDKVQTEMMSMFFELGGDITSFDDLSGAAERAGIERDVARRWLEDGSGGEDVDREVEEMERLGMKGVPKILIDEEFVVEGADDVTAIFEQLHKAKEAKEAKEKTEIQE